MGFEKKVDGIDGGNLPTRTYPISISKTKLWQGLCPCQSFVREYIYISFESYWLNSGFILV